ncbi:MAG: SH3 domain-containing protein [bacterium]|nr:SH3 domain-containing protein [bacterium]
MRFYCLMLAALPLFLGLNGFADTLLLKNNSQLIGKILSESADEFLLDVDGVQLKVKRVDVLSVIQNNVQRDVNAPAQASVSPATQTVPVTETIETATDTGLLPILTPPTTQTEAPTSSFPVAVPGTDQQSAAPVVPEPTATEEEAGSDLPLLPLSLPQGKVYQVIGAGVRFRGGPNLTYPVLDSLPSQTVLLEIEAMEGWLHARTTDGKEGWIHQNFVQPLENTPCLVIGSNLNVREAPGEVYRSLDRLRKGDVVIRLGQQGDWVYVLANATIAGYCHKDFLSPLTDEKVYRPQMAIVRNEDVGMPILVQRNSDGLLQQVVSLTVRDEQIVLGGITKVLVLFRQKETLADPNLNYKSEAIVQKQRMASSTEMVNNRLPEQLAVSFVGCDILTMLGNRIEDGWQYEITIPAGVEVSFGCVVQKGPSRGTVVLVQ